MRPSSRRGPLGPHAVPRFPHERELALTSDEPCLMPPLRRVAHVQETVGGNRLDWNDEPRPFVWHKTADEILDNLAAYCSRISDSGH